MARAWKSILVLVLGLGGGVAASAVWLGRARAGIPTDKPLRYAGKVEDARGEPMTGEHRVQIFLFSSLPDPEPACSTESEPMTLKNGYFSIELPETCSAVVRDNPATFVEVQLDGNPLGRVPIKAVPYALEAEHALKADTAGDAAEDSNLDERIKKTESNVGKLAAIELVSPTTCVTLPATGTTWQDIPGTSLTIDVSDRVKLLATYSINVQPDGDPATSYVATRLTVDGTPEPSSVNHYQPYTNSDSNGSLTGQLLKQLPKGQHVIALQWVAIGGGPWSNCPPNWGPAELRPLAARTISAQAFYY
jgi:hypothetical protein